MKNFFSAVRMNMWPIMGILSAGLLFASCMKSDDDNTNPPVAGLMAFNLAPDASSVGFAISGNNLTPNPLGFNNYTGTYLAIYPGSRSVETYSYSGAELAISQYDFEASKYYSLFLVGTDTSYEQVIVNDNLDSLSGAGKAFVRYINAIPDASVPTVTMSVNGTTAVNDNAAFKSVSGFVAIDPGTVTIHVTNGGNINASRTITLEQQKIYTVLLIGKPGASGDSALQVKYIQNGAIGDTAGRAGKAAAGPMN